MPDPKPIEVGSEEWLVDAGRRLDPPQSDVERLTRSVIDSARKMSHSRSTLVTDLERVVVTDRVVRRLLLVEVREQLHRPVLQVVVDSDAGEVTAIHLGIVCFYDDELIELAASTRAVIVDVFVAALGPQRGRRAAALVDIDWVDLDERMLAPPGTPDR